jgi:hypothetical protein
MTEPYILAIILGTIFLYSLGGMLWKPARRYGIPLFFLGVSLISGSFTIKILGGILALCVALHLGYGQNSNWLMKIACALAISLPVLIIRFNFWIIILPIVFLGTFYLSNRPKWQYIFNWRICEALVGAILGILWSQVL